MLLTLCLCGGSALGAAESEAVREQHYLMGHELIGGNYLLVARRVIDEFGSAGYPEADLWQTALEYQWYHQASLTRSGDAAKEAEARAKELAATLKSRAPLPELIKQHVQPGGHGQINQICERIRRMTNPDSPPPLLTLAPAKVANLRGLVQRLMEVTRTTCEQQLAEIWAYESEVEKTWDMDDDPSTEEGKQYWAILQQATMLRDDWARAMWSAYRALRIIMERGPAYGLDEEFCRQTVPAWLFERLTRPLDPPLESRKNERWNMSKEILDWDWNYADYYPFLKHRLTVVRGEIMRLSGNGFPEVTGHNYDDLMSIFDAQLKLDLDQYPPQAQKAIRRNQLEIWSDVFNLHLLMGTEMAYSQGAEQWARCEEWLKERGWTLDHKERLIQMMVGHLHLLAAQVFHQMGDGPARDALLARIQAAGNFFMGNAKKWIGWYYSSASSGGSPWFRQPRPIDPDAALTTARAFLTEAKAAVEKSIVQRFLVNAAVQLRSGVLGLPDPDSEQFVELAPQLYQMYAFTLYKLGWRYRATIAGLDGLSRFKPEFWGKEPQTEELRGFFDRRGEATKAGEMVQRLARDTRSYAFGMSSRASGQKQFSEVNDRALNYLKQYDPEAYERSGSFSEIIVLINLGEYEEAAALARETFTVAREKGNQAWKDKSQSLAEKNYGNMLRALRYEIQAWYLLWNQEYDRGVGEQRLQQINERMAETVEDVRKYVALHDKGHPALAGLGDQIDHLRRFEANIQVQQRMKAEDWAGILDLLDAGYWENVPDDEAIIRQMLQRMAFATYKQAFAALNRFNTELLPQVRDAEGLAKAVEGGIAEIAGFWPELVFGRLVFNRKIDDFPAIEARSTNARKLLAVCFNMVGRASEDGMQRNLRGKITIPEERKAAIVRSVAERLATRWHAVSEAEGEPELGPEAIGEALREIDRKLFNAFDADGDGALSDADLVHAGVVDELLEYFSQTCKNHYADLYLPLLGPDAKPEDNLAVGATLWELGRQGDAIKPLEYYKASLLRQPEIQAFKADAAQEVEAIRALIPNRRKFEPYWQQGKKGTIPDLLVDAEGFMQDYIEADADTELPEEKRNWSKARKQIREFTSVVEGERLSLDAETYDRVMAELGRLEDLVTKMANLVTVNTWLMEAYYANRDLDNAVAQARELIAYEPLDPQYMMMEIQGTIEAAGVDQETLEKALGTALRLRNMLTPPDDDEKLQYWRVYVQVLVLSAKLGRFEPVNNLLRSNNARNINPVEDLYELVEQNFPKGALLEGEGLYIKDVDTGDGQVETRRYRIRRPAMKVTADYLEVFDAYDQVSVPAPIEVVEEEVTDVENPQIKKTIYVLRKQPTAQE
ncbi:MAG: hypothetical protein ACOCVS_02565 [Planctomycetota bacterium]